MKIELPGDEIEGLLFLIREGICKLKETEHRNALNHAKALEIYDKLNEQFTKQLPEVNL